MSLPLEGIRVADFTHVMAGPFATHLLRLLGAEVIKIEAPGRGDTMRSYGNDRRYDGMAPAFIAVNAGKKSMTLDLKQPLAQEAARRLIATCDVLVENFRPGVMAKFGLDYTSVRALRPELIYCSISGYGQSGPRRDWPAIDNIVQATTGMMTLGGTAGDAPARVGFPVVDTLTGQTAAFAILAALLRRQRERRGEYIDVAMFDASMAFMTSAVVPYLVTGNPPERTGNIGYSGQPTSAVFTASDGRQISLGVVQQAQFETLAREVGCEDWLSDARFLTPDLRRKHSAEMRLELEGVFHQAPAEQWESRLSAAGIPCGMVRNVTEAVSLPALEARRLKLDLSIPGLPEREQVKIVNAGFLFSEDTPGVNTAPPRIGEHSHEILDSLGFSPAEIEQLQPPKRER
ncbi:CoA transferase [Steroidobacter sp. S1-65]|uniref:CoA transferase n=1 Tax=Steroidobacter gossypii TaxID=2805490 RepID=A0ABS1WZ96_9GAMM|nr:CaiB/BaiF CoA-transferase family protein [Steroidobacter gossypii]MBM0106305.1 CoA transferase [Steroidobacter gossypii]